MLTALPPLWLVLQAALALPAPVRLVEAVRCATEAQAALLLRDPGRRELRVAVADLDGRALERLWSQCAPRCDTANLVWRDGELWIGLDPVLPDGRYRIAVDTGVGGPAMATAAAARTLDLDALRRQALATAARAETLRAGFPAPAVPARVERGDATHERDGMRIVPVAFTSPQPSGEASNDRVACRLFLPARAARGAVVVLPIWIETKGPLLEEAQCRFLAQKGFAALLLPLPYQHERTLPGETTGRGTMSTNVERTLRAWRQAVADVRAARELLPGLTGVTRDQVALLGTSLGGYVAGLAFGVDPSWPACAMLLAGGNLADVVWNTPLRKGRTKDELLQKGISLEQLRAILEPLDPLSYADPARREGLFLGAGLFDTIAPPEHVEALWRAYGEPETTWIRADHYSGVTQLPNVMARVVAFFERRLAPREREVLIRAGKVFPMDQPPILDGCVLVRGGRIAAVGRGLVAPAGAEVLEFKDGWVFPGMVELHCHVGMTSGGDINEMVLPQNPELRTLDMVSLEHPDLVDAARAGVTTVLMLPGSGTTVGGLGTLAKTLGPSLEQRLIRFPGALKIALYARGGNPSRGSGDLGLARQGLHYMLAELFAEAQRYHQKWNRFEASQGQKPEFSARLDQLRGLFQHKYPVILHAYGANDTMTAVRILKERFGLKIILSHGEYESFKIADVLAKTGVPMNIGPTLFEFEEGKVVGNPDPLWRAGVPTSLCTDSPVLPQEELFLQGTMAARLGMDAEACVRGLTIEPAKAVMADHRIGSLAPGKDADLFITRGDPLDPRYRPVLVMIDGRVVHRE